MPHPTRSIVETDTLTPEGRQHLFHFEPDVFSLDAHHLEWEPKTRFFHVYEGDALVGNAGVVARTVDVGETATKVAGIGGVVCRPEARGRGHATAAVASALTYATGQLGCDFGMLFCRPALVDFYARTGWQSLQVPVLIDQPAGTIPSPLQVMIKPLADRPWPAGPVRVNGKPW